MKAEGGEKELRDGEGYMGQGGRKWMGKGTWKGEGSQDGKDGGLTSSG